jgi:hypothetical protein
MHRTSSFYQEQNPCSPLVDLPWQLFEGVEKPACSTTTNFLVPRASLSSRRSLFCSDLF